MLSPTGEKWLRLLRAFSIMLATAIACICVIYFSIPMQDTQQSQFDVILVLGNPASEDGTLAPIGESRLREALELYRAGVAPRLLLTGGAVKNRFVESDVMRQFVLSQGVPASAVLTEGQSRNTIQNAYFAYKIMQAHDWTSALVVTSPTHVRRASLIFMRYPLAWRMQVAPWPDSLPLWKKIWFWISEAGYTSYGRFFGFPNPDHNLPNTHFAPPHL
jgi:uncharacterized SAM-binding protein YcdF (DUF218 family)